VTGSTVHADDQAVQQLAIILQQDRRMASLLLNMVQPLMQHPPQHALLLLWLSSPPTHVPGVGGVAVQPLLPDATPGTVPPALADSAAGPSGSAGVLGTYPSPAMAGNQCGNSDICEPI
jgi:hypothetical protein